MKNLIRAGATAPVLLLLAACASTGDYPSLSVRDAERAKGSAEPVASPPVPIAQTVPPDASLVERLARLVAQAESAHGRFMGQRASAEVLVGTARDAAVASESWSVATIALAGLESARSDTMIALTELDGLLAADRVAHYNEQSGDGQAIAASREKVLALVAEEDQTLDHLRF